MLAFELEWETCQDGFECLIETQEWHDHRKARSMESSANHRAKHFGRDTPDQEDWDRAARSWENDKGPRAFVRPKSGIVRPIKLQFNGLEDTAVLHFINATTPKQLETFCWRFGIPAPSIVPRRRKVPARAYLDDLSELRGNLEDLLRATEFPEQFAASYNAVAAGDAGWYTGLGFLTPSVIAEDGNCRLALQPTSLPAYMVMETAMVAVLAARVVDCEFCKSAFLIGPTTGRRSHARYCSDRCRVAAMRQRNREGA